MFNVEHENIAHAKHGAKVEAVELGLERKITEGEGSGDNKSKNSPLASEGTIKIDTGEERIEGCNLDM